MFSGYSNGTIEFFLALEFNNNVDFFHANHDWYLRDVREPSLELAAALSDTMEQIDADLERRPNRVVARINRDIRFSHDKSPYKDYLFLNYKPTGERPSTALNLYFALSPKIGAVYGLGLYGQNRSVTDEMRRRIAADPIGMQKALDAAGTQFTLFSESYKKLTVPPHIPEGLLPFYKTKGFYLETTIMDEEKVYSPLLADELKQGFMKLAPLYRFFNCT